MEVFSKEQLAEIQKILGTERADLISSIEDYVARYKLVHKSNEHPKQARVDLKELSKRSLAYFKFLKKFRTDTRGYKLTIAESCMREVLPGKINLEDLAKKVFETRFAANTAYGYLPGGRGMPENWHFVDFINRLAKAYSCITGKSIEENRRRPFYRFVRICLSAAGHELDQDIHKQIRKALQKSANY